MITCVDLMECKGKLLISRPLQRTWTYIGYVSIKSVSCRSIPHILLIGCQDGH